ncbi:MAG: hypothetical protein H0Z28_04060 [Archaeoglobus sp.]|nr:hypothetical protein [Archaeoglobus sp.]
MADLLSWFRKLVEEIMKMFPSLDELAEVFDPLCRGELFASELEKPNVQLGYTVRPRLVKREFLG